MSPVAQEGHGTAFARTSFEVICMHTLALADSPWRLFGSFSAGDVAVIAVLLASMGIGFWTGFVWQFIRIGSLAICILVTLLYSPLVADSLDLEYSAAVKLQMSAVAVFATTMTVSYLVAYLLRDVVNALKPQTTDRILGAAFGLVRGALLVGALSLLVLTYSEEESVLRAEVEQSRTAAVMGYFLQYALPDSVREQIKTRADMEAPPPGPPGGVETARGP
jgi:membrane protein required for colicin V production